MKMTKVLLAVGIACAGMAWQANADLINEEFFDNSLKPNGDAAEVSFMETELGFLAGTLTHLGKVNPGGSSLLGGAITVTGYVDDDVDSVFIEWDLTGTGWLLAGVMVADGQPAGFTIYGVSDDQMLASGGQQLARLNPAADGRGGISHISFFGKQGTTNVPDGGATFMLLGAALAGMGLIRRRLS